MNHKIDKARLEYAVLNDSATLRITSYLGTSAAHVVAFTGIGFAMGGIQTEEFRRSLTDGERRHAVTFIIDKAKSWFNATAADILPILQAETAGARRVVTLGNSMGGFGAAYFAGLLPRCDRAIAFAPQFAVSPGAIPPEEYRWAVLRKAIERHGIDHALDHQAPGRRYIVFCGARSGLDRAHAERFKAVGGEAVDVFLIANGRHDVAADLKASGGLHALLDLLIDRDAFDAGEVRHLLAAYGVGSAML